MEAATHFNQAEDDGEEEEQEGGVRLPPEGRGSNVNGMGELPPPPPPPSAVVTNPDEIWQKIPPPPPSSQEEVQVSATQALPDMAL